MTAPALDMSRAARAERHYARLRALRLARRDAWRRSAGDPDEFRRLMAAWLRANRTRP